ncbi:hypothetical protein [Microbacterium sp. ProA8]|uniref:hypothetical protein n=1 Tax=Microbacterium chionoecetis TaxID=3153754 RepID=UPI003265FAF1
MRVLTFDSPDTWAAYQRGFLAEAANAAERFRRSVGASIALDKSPESLDAVGTWLVDKLQHPEPAWDTLDWLPVWLHPGLPLAGSGTDSDGPFTRAQLESMDQVHGYIVEVLLTQRPTAKWVIFTGAKRDIRRGSTMLDIGRRQWPINTIGLIYKVSLDVVLDGDLPPAGWLRNAVEAEFAKATG